MKARLGLKLNLYTDLQKEFNLPNELVPNLPVLSNSENILSLLIVESNSTIYLPFYYQYARVDVKYFKK